MSQVWSRVAPAPLKSQANNGGSAYGLMEVGRTLRAAGRCSHERAGITVEIASWGRPPARSRLHHPVGTLSTRRKQDNGNDSAG